MTAVALWHISLVMFSLGYKISDNINKERAKTEQQVCVCEKKEETEDGE